MRIFLITLQGFSKTVKFTHATSSWIFHEKLLNHWTALHSGLRPHGKKSTHPIPSPADLPDLGIELGSPALQTDSLPSERSGTNHMFIKH